MQTIVVADDNFYSHYSPQIQFIDTEEGLEVLDISRRATPDSPLEDITLDESVNSEDKLVECLKDDLEGRKVKVNLFLKYFNIKCLL